MATWPRDVRILSRLRPCVAHECAMTQLRSINNWQRTPGVSPGVNALVSATLMSFLRFQGFWPGLFNDLSAGEFCPLRIPPTSRGLRFPPLISREKDGGLSPVTQKRHQGRALPPGAMGVSPWVCTPEAQLPKERKGVRDMPGKPFLHSFCL